MRYWVCFLGCMVLAGSASAQQTVTKINGVDQRLPVLEKKILVQELVSVTERASAYAAQLVLEKQDHADTTKQLAAVNEFWKNWCGKSPGCATPPATALAE
jgi:hypothetical protein